MIVTDAVLRVRDYVPLKTTILTDAFIVTTMDAVVASLVRRMIERQVSYSNAEINIREVDFKKVSGEQFDIGLPSWVKRVEGVERRTPQGVEHISPWGGDPDNRSSHLLHAKRGDQHLGWEWFNRSIFRLRSAAQGLDLVLRVAKLPAPMFKGVIAHEHNLLSYLYMPTTYLLGSERVERGNYIGHRVQITVSDNDSLGDSRIVVNDTPNKRAGNPSVKVHELQVSHDWTQKVPKTVATVESELEIDEDHLELVILVCVEKIFQRHNNTSGIRSIRDALAREWVEFGKHITPRQTQEPNYLRKSTVGRFGPTDPDLANSRLRSPDRF